MEGLAGIFFVLMALLLLVTYMAIRREWFAPGKVAAVAVVGSIVLMTLISLGQGNSALQAIIVGIIVGGLFSGATVGIAWHFQNQELRRHGADYEEPYYEYEQSDETA